MIITIIPIDQIVVIDGEVREIDFEVDANYHAIQWDGASGFIETKAGDNIVLENMNEFAPIIAAFNAQKAQDAEALAAQAAYEQTAEYKNAQAEQSRQSAYTAESDPLFFKYQRGEATEQEWLDKIAEIKTRYPKVDE